MLIRSVAFLLLALSLPLSFGQKQSVYPAKPIPPRTEQEVLLLFSGDTADERIILTLNNNRVSDLVTSIAVHSADGAVTKLPDITLVASDSALIELSPLLKKAGLGSQTLGWLQLDYSGVTLEMGAQLTLYPIGGASGVDSARSLSSDFKGHTRYASFWMPQSGTAYLSLTNNSLNAIDVQLNCGGLLEAYTIQAKVTKQRQITTDLLGIPGAAKGKESYCGLVSTGAVDALRAVGTVRGLGYTAPIRFYDPLTATFPSLTAVGLRTSAKSFVTAYNTTNSPVIIVPELLEAVLKLPLTVSLKPRTIAPRSSITIPIDVPLQSFATGSISRITLTLKTSASKGSIVGSVTQISTEDGLIEDIPLRTSNPPAFARGSYPLRWDKDYTNLVTVTNTSAEILGLQGAISAGDTTYVLTKTPIEPGATLVLDVDKWRKDGVPDVNGNTLPKDAPFGKIHWIEMSNGKKAGLLGRTSLSSLADQRRSSFSCGSTCQYNYYTVPYFDPSVFVTLAVGSSQTSSITDYTSPTNGPGYAYPQSYESWGSDISITTPSIISVGPDSSNDSNVVLSANSAGTTNMDYGQYSNDYTYDIDNESCDESGAYQDNFGSGEADKAYPIVAQSCKLNTSPPTTYTLTASWGVFGGCALSDGTVLSIQTNGSCTESGCYSYPSGPGRISTVCPASPRAINNSCTMFSGPYLTTTTTTITQ